MVYEKLGCNVLSCNGDENDMTCLTARTFLEVLSTNLATGNKANNITFNNDSCMNYNERQQIDDGCDTTNMCQAAVLLNITQGNPDFFIYNGINIAGDEKLFINHTVTRSTAGAGNAPRREESTFKWTDTCCQITRIDNHNTGTGCFTAGSTTVAFGSD